MHVALLLYALTFHLIHELIRTIVPFYFVTRQGGPSKHTERTILIIVYTLAISLQLRICQCISMLFHNLYFKALQAIPTAKIHQWL